MQEDNIIQRQRQQMEEASQQAGGPEQTIAAPDPDFIYRHAARDLFKNRFQKPKFIIQDVIPKGTVLVAIGEDGIGKTQFYSQLCLTICYKKTDFLGLPLTVDNHSALICATEDAKEKFTGAMVKQIHYFNPNQQDNDEFFPDLDFAEAADFENWDHMSRVLEKYFSIKKYELVVIDAMLDLFNYLPKGSANNNDDATTILSRLQTFCLKYGVTIIVIHHTSKSALKARHLNGEMLIEKNDQLGAGRITSKPRTVHGLSNHKDSLSEDGSYYINYFHVLKANLMKRTYEKQVLKCKFLTNELIHVFDSFVTPDEVNGGAAPAPAKEVTDTGHVKNKPAKLLTYEQHVILAGSIFEQVPTYSTLDTLVPALSAAYQIGDRAIRTEYIPYLKTIGLLVKTSNGYQFKQGELPKEAPF